MNTWLWILQVVLAANFLGHAWFYLAWPTALVDWASHHGPKFLGLTPGFRHFIGVAEALGAAGLILPGLTGLGLWLTPLAAAGLMIVMAGAVVFHLSGREIGMVLVCGLEFVLVTLVAYVRWRVLPL
jgi:hypothetical protein